MVETGSTTTASATTHSQSNGDFPALGEKPRIVGLARGRWVSASGHIGSRRQFRRLCLWSQNSVSRQQRPRQADTGSNAALLLGKGREFGVARTIRLGKSARIDG